MEAKHIDVRLPFLVIYLLLILRGGVPQLVRGPGSYPGRRRFESDLRYHITSPKNQAQIRPRILQRKS